MNVGLLVALIVAGALLFAGTLVFLIVSAVRRQTARAMAVLHGEGIILDSGRVHLKLSFRGFRGPRVAIGIGMNAGPGRVVLTQRRFTFVPWGQNRYGFTTTDRELLHRFAVGVDEGRLHLHSDNPPNASGTVDIFVSVANPAEWVEALTAAGAVRRAGG
ncbi:MAG: hypothetical protein ABSE49_05365 [Polyangiaceae bacterium]